MPFKSQVRALNQTAVYWSAPTFDGLGGSTFTIGADIACRWEDKAELFLDLQGKEQRSSAVVFVSSDLAVGGYLYLGSVDDLTTPQKSDPMLIAAYEIRAIEKIPSIDAQRFTRKVWL